MPVISRAPPSNSPTRRTALKYAQTKRDNSSVATDVLHAFCPRKTSAPETSEGSCT